jgi:putative acetyltransferase
VAQREWVPRERDVRMNAPVIDVEPVLAPADDVRRLVEELERELSQHYPPEQRHGLSLEKLFQPGVLFFVARVTEERTPVPAGCGGIALADGFAELKRMYVRPVFRGRGVAAAILSRLEHEARLTGRDLVRLETGVHQRAAIRFYTRSGYLPCGAFEPYASMAANAISTSVFLEKRLTSSVP